MGRNPQFPPIGSDVNVPSWRKTTVQDVHDYLEGYNRLYSSWTRNRASSDAKAKGLANYEKWFEQRGIRLALNQRTKKWEVDHIKDG